MRPLPIAFLALCSLVGCTAPDARLSASVASLGLQGSIGADQGGNVVNTPLSDLGITDDELSPYPRLELSWDRTHLDTSLFAASYRGTGVLSGDVHVDGVHIPAGSEVTTDLTFGALTSVLTYDVLPIGAASLALGLGLTLIDLDFEMVATGSGDRIVSDQILPMPLLAARLDWASSPLSLGASVGGIDLSYSEGSASVLDLDLHGELRLFGGGDRLRVGVVGGYRSFSADGTYDDGATRVQADVRLAGPYLGIDVSF